MKQLKIACIGARGIPSNYSGIERVCEGLYSELAKRGHDITVYCRPEHISTVTESYRGVRLFSAPALRMRSLETLSHVAASLMHAVVLGHYDVIHLHALAPGLFSLLCRLGRVPTVATIHGLDWGRAKWRGAASKALRLGEKCLVRDADQLIVVSHDLQSYFWEHYGRATVHIPNGVEELTPAERQDTVNLSEHGLQPGAYVLYLGRLVPEKRIEDLIIAYRNVPGPRRLVLTGSGVFTHEYVEKLRRLAAEDSRVIFTGAQDRVAVHTLLHNAALYVLPSELEGLPISLLECIQHGTPAVVSDIAPHRELLGSVPQYDLFFPAKDVKALADRMTLALSAQGHYRVVASHARELVMPAHSWPAIAKRTEEVYYASVGRTSPKPARVSVPVGSRYGVWQ